MQPRPTSGLFSWTSSCFLGPRCPTDPFGPSAPNLRGWTSVALEVERGRAASLPQFTGEAPGWTRVTLWLIWWPSYAGWEVGRASNPITSTTPCQSCLAGGSSLEMQNVGPHTCLKQVFCAVPIHRVGWNSFPPASRGLASWLGGIWTWYPALASPIQKPREGSTPHFSE